MHTHTNTHTRTHTHLTRAGNIQLNVAPLRVNPILLRRRQYKRQLEVTAPIRIAGEDTDALAHHVEVAAAPQRERAHHAQRPEA
jgi:hypothetical protein